jgi:Protein of unknown function (DUF2971)
MSAQTAVSVLLRMRLRWSAPEIFNDPFEFKNPMEFAFEWRDLEQPLLDTITRLVTQKEEPELLPDGPTAENIRSDRVRFRWSGLEFQDIRRMYEPGISTLVNRFRSDTSYHSRWSEMKREYRVLCFAETETNILLWSHYASSHKGIVLAFEPCAPPRSDLAAARKVSYSRDVLFPVTLQDMLLYLTSQAPKPKSDDAFVKSVFTKSEDWSYEKEWRILRKVSEVGPDRFIDLSFPPEELVAIYLGCRVSESSKEEIIAAARTFPAPLTFFQMKDEPKRFELTSIPITH